MVSKCKRTFNALLEYALGLGLGLGLGLKLGLGLGRGRLSTKDLENCCEFCVLKRVKVTMTEIEFDEQLTVSQLAIKRAIRNVLTFLCLA